MAEFPEGERVAVFPVRIDGEDVLVQIEPVIGDAISTGEAG
jgi:hypothetical protein